MGVSKGNRIKKLVLQSKLALEESIQLERGRGKLFNTLCVTDRGMAFLGRQNERPGKGGPLHRDFQQRVHGQLKAWRLPSTIEAYRNGKAVDVGFEINGKSWAAEVTTTCGKNEVDNLTKDLEAGFDQVVFIAKDLKVQAGVQRHLANSCEKRTKSQWNVCLLNEFFTLVECELNIRTEGISPKMSHDEQDNTDADIT
ncbi:hypothetical protein BVY01_00730 [bacterium I07]|nr:hypothetical protein BVY01_00730 [bacterium I07]